MRSVPGADFRFDFAPSRGRDAIPWTECYPGDDYVDVIGMDSYDQPPGVSFTEQIKEPYGLQAQVDFAQAHGKPVSYPEWGLFRNGDNPDYIRQMLALDRRAPPRLPDHHRLLPARRVVLRREPEVLGDLPADVRRAAAELRAAHALPLAHQAARKAQETR